MDQTVPQTMAINLIKSSLTDQAYEGIKRQILDQELKPGEKLNVDALVRLYGVSTSPLREALFKLQGEGLVSSIPNAGFFVTPIPDTVRLRQMLELRWMIERHCARIGAARRDPQTLAAMKHAIETMQRLSAEGMSYQQYRAYAEADQSLHLALVESASNAVITQTYKNLDMVLLVARLSVAPNSNSIGSADGMREHLAILQAFEHGDPDEADAAVQRHAEGSLGRMHLPSGVTVPSST